VVVLTPKKSEKRHGVRMRITKGFARIYHPAMPSLRCILLDVSEGGARCRADNDIVPDEFILSSWRRVLGTEAAFHVEFLVPGDDQDNRLEAKVRHLKVDMEGSVDFGLEFSGMNRYKQQLLEKATRSLTRGLPTPVASRARLATPTPVVSHVPPPVVVPRPKPAPRRGGVAGFARSLWNSVTGAGTCDFRKMKIGEVLQRMGKLSPPQAIEAYEKSRSSGVKFGRYLIDQHLVNPAELCRALSLQSGLPIVDLVHLSVPPGLKSLFPYDLLTQSCCLPFNKVGNAIYVAAAQPLTGVTLQKLERQCHLAIKPFLAPEDALQAKLHEEYGPIPIESRQ
jgi:hypothetical protein